MSNSVTISTQLISSNRDVAVCSIVTRGGKKWVMTCYLADYRYNKVRMHLERESYMSECRRDRKRGERSEWWVRGACWSTMARLAT